MRLEEEEPDQDKEFPSQEYLKEAFVPFDGPLFQEDNRKFFDILHSLLVNGPKITWIKKCEASHNGREAWLKLVAQYEGDSKRTRTRVAARASVQKAEYRGDRKNFDFSTYKCIHTQSHIDLEQCGQPVYEEKKVEDLLAGITAPELEAVKFTMAGFPDLMNSFEIRLPIILVIL